MIVDGERLKALLGAAKNEVVLCAPFIKERVLKSIMSVVPKEVPIKIYTRWRPTEVAAGVSDLAVYNVAGARDKTQLYLLDNLHAKLYVADTQAYVGSANLTAAALGWSENSNVEILVLLSSSDPDVVRLTESLKAARPATQEFKDQIQKEVDAMGAVPKMDPSDASDADFEAFSVAWLPRCAAPQKLFSIYKNASTSSVIEGTRIDGLADLKALNINAGLEQIEFNKSVGNTLLLMPAFSKIIQSIPSRITDAQGLGLVKDIRPNFTDADAQYQWHIIRDWVQIFFQDKFEIAPDSFVIRLKS